MKIDVSRLTRDYTKYPLKPKEIPCKEDILYLYMELNLSRKQLMAYFDRKSSIDKWLQKYNIHKPKEMWVESTKQEWKEKYGVENIAKLSEVKDKKRKTSLQRYGVEHHISAKSVREKSKQTMKERYGVEHAFQSEEVKKKIRQTNLERYGVEVTLQAPHIKEQIRISNLEKYGVEAPTKSEVVKEKIRQTNLERYGVEVTTQAEKVKEKLKQSIRETIKNHNDQITAKRKQTSFERYGVESASQLEQTKAKAKETNLRKYGVEYPIQLEEYKQKRRETNLARFERINISQTHLSEESIHNLQHLDKFIQSLDFSPTITELANMLNVSYSSIQIKLNELNLWSYINRSTSNGEHELRSFLQNYTMEFNNRLLLNPYEIDLYIPEVHLGIEFNGDYWHSDIYKKPTYHQEKSKLALEKGIFIYHIFEHEWENPISRKIIESQLKCKLGESNRIFARKTKLVSLDYTTTSNFLNVNHLQGTANSSVNYGLMYNDELVAVMTFAKPRFNKKYQWELIRYCSKLNTTIIGGASKLLNQFVKEQQPSSIISYCNLSKGQGNLYKQLNFSFNGYSSPNYIWVFGNKYLTRYQTQKHKLVEQGFDENLSETEIMYSRGYHRVFDCGNTIWTRTFLY